MNRFMMLLAAAIIAAVCPPAPADEIICVGGRCALPRARAVIAAPIIAAETVVAPVVRIAAAPVRVLAAAATPVRIVSAPPVMEIRSAPVCCETQYTGGGAAQVHASRLAAAGRFHHSGSLCGARYEGIGRSSVSAEAATRACCYWGRRPVKEIGTAWCPALKQYIAVVHYF